MKTLASIYQDGQVYEGNAVVTFNSILPSGYGHWKITCDVQVEYNGSTTEKRMHLTTTDEDYFQSTKSCESREDYNDAISNIEYYFSSQKEGMIDEMLYDLVD